jgi:hypothetical protein
LPEEQCRDRTERIRLVNGLREVLAATSLGKQHGRNGALAPFRSGCRLLSPVRSNASTTPHLRCASAVMNQSCVDTDWGLLSAMMVAFDDNRGLKVDRRTVGKPT